MKIFYYEDEFENLLEEQDAQQSSIEELIDYLYNLENDDISYVGFIENDQIFKITSNDYDHYIVYHYENEKDKYLYFKELNFDKLKDFVSERLKNKSAENDSKIIVKSEVFRKYEGKDYTKEEWEKYEAEQWKKFKDKGNNE